MATRRGSDGSRYDTSPEDRRLVTDQFQTVHDETRRERGPGREGMLGSRGDLSHRRQRAAVANPS